MSFAGDTVYDIGLFSIGCDGNITRKITNGHLCYDCSCTCVYDIDIECATTWNIDFFSIARKTFAFFRG